MVKPIDFNETYPIRKLVLRENKGPEKVPFLGDELKDSFHFGFFWENKLIGILTAIEIETQKYQFRGMAILPEHQSKKLGVNYFVQPKNIYRN